MCFDLFILEVSCIVDKIRYWMPLIISVNDKTDKVNLKVDNMCLRYTF